MVASGEGDLFLGAERLFLVDRPAGRADIAPESRVGSFWERDLAAVVTAGMNTVFLYYCGWLSIFLDFLT